MRESVEEKVQSIYHKKVTEVDEKRKVAVFDWEERHPDIKLNHDLTCMYVQYKIWPSDLMDELDEIDRQTAWSQRRIYIDRLVKAEKQMQKLVNFWKDCKLITGQRAPASPAIRSPDFFSKFATNRPRIRRKPITKRLLGLATNTSRKLAAPSQGLRPSSYIEKENKAFRSSKQLGWATPTPQQRTPMQVTREAGLIGISLFKSPAQRSTCQNLETSGMDAFVPARETPR